MRRGLAAWQAWLIASTLCLTQAYLVAKFIGWNFGGYVIAFIAGIPSMLSGNPYNAGGDLGYWFWVLPPLVLIVLPAALLYVIGKAKSAEKDGAIKH
jgi:hypothetical protein